MNLLYAQLAGAAAMLLIALSVQCRKKKHILLVQLFANIFYAVQYMFLNAPAGLFPSLIAILRNLAFYLFENKKKKIPWYAPTFIIILILIVAYYSYDGIISLIPIIIAIAYTVGQTFKNPRKFKYIFGVCSVIWIIYNFKVHAYIGVLGNIMEITSAVTAIKREKILEKKKQERRNKRKKTTKKK